MPGSPSWSVRFPFLPDARGERPAGSPAGPRRRIRKYEPPAVRRNRCLDLSLEEISELADWLDSQLRTNEDMIRRAFGLSSSYLNQLRDFAGDRLPFLLAANIDHLRESNRIPNPICVESVVEEVLLCPGGAEITFLIIEGPYAGYRLNFRVSSASIPVLLHQAGYPKRLIRDLSYRSVKGLRAYAELKVVDGRPVISRISMKHRKNREVTHERGPG